MTSPEEEAREAEILRLNARTLARLGSGERLVQALMRSEAALSKAEADRDMHWKVSHSLKAQLDAANAELQRRRDADVVLGRAPRRKKPKRGAKRGRPVAKFVRSKR